MKHGEIELVPNQPTLLDLINLAETVRKINDASFTRAMAEAMHKVNRPTMVYKEQPNDPR